MAIIERELALLLHITGDIYNTPYITLPDIGNSNISKLVSLAVDNGMGYYTVKILVSEHKDKVGELNLSMLQEIVNNGDKRYAHIEETIQALNSCINDYLLIKTYRNHVRIANDLDVLVHDLNKAIEILDNAGFKYAEHDAKEQKAIFYYQGNTKIHLHGNISWGKGGTVFIDKDLIWAEPKNALIGRTSIKVPNVNADFLIHLAHINYENLQISMSEYLYIFELAEKVDWGTVFTQASKHKWVNTLKRTLTILDTIHHTLYSTSCPFNLKYLKHQRFNDRKILSFPFSLSRKKIILAWLEKGLAIWVLCHRIIKMIHILFPGNTQRGFKPSELEQIIEPKH